MELHRFFRYAIEKMCKEKKSLNHFILKQANCNKKVFHIFSFLCFLKNTNIYLRILPVMLKCMIYNLSMHDFYKIILMQFLLIMFYKVLRQVWEYAILSDRKFCNVE